MDFPIISTKTANVTKSFDLNTPAGRFEYFNAKLGKEIEDIKMYLQDNTFVAYMLAKKSAGKGTYSKLFQEIIGTERVETISIGDLVRETNMLLESENPEKEELINYINQNYRGYMPTKEALDQILSRTSDKISVPAELILVLIKRKIESNKKAFFIDGFPRTADQISYSLYFREIMRMRNDPDFFIVIDVPDSIIDERIKYRRICPLCNTPRNIKLLPTENVKYDSATGQYILLCDNTKCEGYGKSEMVGKEGDEKGIENIRQRLDNDQVLMENALNLHGIPIVKVRNHVPVKQVDSFDKYEITPEYVYTYNKEKDLVEITEKPWTVNDNVGDPCHSLLPAAAVLGMIKQIHKILIG